MTSKDNTIYYTLTAVVFIGIVVCSLLFHNAGQPTNGDSDKGFMTESISTIVIAAAAVVTAGATIVLAVITSRYVKATNRYVEIADETLRASDTPKVQVSLINRIQSYGIWTVDLCVQNIGTGFAYDIKFSGDLSSLYPQTGRESLAEYSIIKNGISHLGTGKRYQIPIIWQPLNLDPPEKTFDVGVTYRDSAGTPHKEEYCLDFTKNEGYTQIGDPSIEHIARSLAHIDKTLREIEKKQNNPNE